MTASSPNICSALGTQAICKLIILFHLERICSFRTSYCNLACICMLFHISEFLLSEESLHLGTLYICSSFVL